MFYSILTIIVTLVIITSICLFIPWHWFLSTLPIIVVVIVAIVILKETVSNYLMAHYKEEFLKDPMRFLEKYFPTLRIL